MVKKNTALTMMFIKNVIGIFVMMCLLATAQASQTRFVLISHAPDSDSWWNTVKNAVKEASITMQVEVDYRNPSNGDLADMARIIEQAIASNPDGLIVSIADYNVLKKPLNKAAKKGIPVITINSGTAKQSKDLGALLHVGQEEYDAGYAAGIKARTAGVKQFLCVNHYITNPASVERCQGYADAIGTTLSKSMLDSSQDPSSIEKKVQAYLRKNPETNGILTLGPTSAHPTIRAVNKLKNTQKIHFTTFDFSNEIALAIDNRLIDFAIDQQPYLQGFMPVVMLSLYVRYGIYPSNNMKAGPAYITIDNVDSVRNLAGTVR